ncbi:kelch-like protein 7 isoform X2 [Boleophthalmus pectinirostris]|uniref:kelch-like protein 7 isoform X2 n=1 Tax=Boleophthalmus pectinirostris TaxID=150288 RepID=UPI00242A70F5|nr:kelch-like protein 7 isoform X2 [Boleophthalmus pectinirostris]
MTSAIPKNAASLKRQCAMEVHNQHQATIMDNLNNMRKQETLCDVTLVVQGKSFAAHRAVLAAASHFFRLMFTTKMMEYTSQEVELRGAEPTIVELLIEFIYTAKILVNSSNVQSLLDAANQYQLEPVKKMCVEFIKGQIDATNCLELKAVAEDFVLLHFTEVYKQEEFLMLDVTRLAHLLHQDQLAVQSEAQIYNAAVHWLKYDVCNRKQYIAEVLGCVRFPFVSKTFLYKILQDEPLMQDNPQWLKMVMSGLRCHLAPDQQQLQPRRNKCNHIIAVFGSPRLQTTNCYYFNPKECAWTEVGSASIKSQKGTAVFCNNVIYITSGHRAYQMAAYNVLTRKIQLLSAPPTNREFVATCASDGKIYTSGGVIGQSTVTVFECFDTKTRLWHVKPKMLVARRDHGSVEVNGLIYVCGGTHSTSVSSRILNNCEVFDPNIEQWSKICGMKDARKNHGLVVVNNRIYAIGGQGATGGLKSVEYYDTDRNQWHSASPVPWRGVSLKCAAVGERIYVLAGKGFEGMPHLKHVLEYNTRTDRWITCHKTEAFSQPTCLTCVINVPHNDKEK